MAGRSIAKTNLWIIGSSEHFCTDCPQLTSENQDDRDANAKRPGFQFNFPQDVLKPHRASGGAKGKHMRFQVPSFLLKSAGNPCPVCGAETALTEIEPHPLHAKFEIHGYLCDTCGPIKSLVVLRLPRLQSKDSRESHFLETQQMTEAEGKSVSMVRVTVKLRPDQYDELFQYVREIGSTMSAFFRESAVKAMREGRSTEDGAVSGRDLPGHQSKPGGEVAALGEHIAGADRRDRDDRPDSKHRHQTHARRVSLHQVRDVGGQAFDTLVKPPPGHRPNPR